MDDLHARFRRLDRVRTPDLWYEAVGRAAAADVARRPAFNPTLVLIALALLTAALAGAITVGSWLNRPAPIPKVVTYENGMVVASPDCGQLVGLDPDTLVTRQLVPQQRGCEDASSLPPAWSLNGERLAYIVPAHDETPNAVWVYEAAAGAAHMVAPCRGWCSSVAASPDGSLVAYLDIGQEAPALVVTAIDSGESTTVELIGSPRAPVFSPDGQRIALPLLGGRSGLYLVDVSRAAQGDVGTPYLLHGIVDASDAAWSPDGEWIAITQVGGLGELGTGDLSPFNGQVSLAGVGIVAVRRDGSDVRVLATGPLDQGPALPTWSADSNTVAYVELSAADASGTSTVALSTVGLDGSPPTRIWESGCCTYGSSRPAWSPDGEWIVLSISGADSSVETGTFLITPDGADIRFVPTRPWEPVWQPIPNE